LQLRAWANYEETQPPTFNSFSVAAGVHAGRGEPNTLRHFQFFLSCSRRRTLSRFTSRSICWLSILSQLQPLASSPRLRRLLRAFQFFLSCSRK